MLEHGSLALRSTSRALHCLRSMKCVSLLACPAACVRNFTDQAVVEKFRFFRKSAAGTDGAARVSGRRKIQRNW
jgi:hypothetical protein